MAATWGQPGYDVRLEWGGEGVGALGGVCAVLVVVDVLSFCTTTDLVLARGNQVLPVKWGGERGIAVARGAGAIIAGEGEWTLRPSSVTEIPAGKLLALPSPNGATLCEAAATTDALVLAGCLRNASAVAARALELAEGRPIGVIPAGERWGVDLLSEAVEFGPLRPCVEDQLGAGAIIAALAAASRSLSPEAALAAAAFGATDITDALTRCASGQELIAAGHANDVVLAAQPDVSTEAPVLTERILS
ncbi:2-phosphosulfolactate phosphatase [Amycolatopsis sp. NPDC058986]|uniref:2-phosphosulfolactate phosphatase n=1 Tax=unclassified Amycolatopsis TaxID=2618356 RepID=UPI00366F0BE2